MRSVTDRRLSPRSGDSVPLLISLASLATNRTSHLPTPCDSHAFPIGCETRLKRRLRGRVAARGCSCIDWSMHPQRRVINHLAPVSTRCTSFPLVVRIARATPLKGSEGRKEKKKGKISFPSFPPCSGNQSTIFQSHGIDDKSSSVRSVPRDQISSAGFSRFCFSLPKTNRSRDRPL